MEVWNLQIVFPFQTAVNAIPVLAERVISCSTSQPSHCIVNNPTTLHSKSELASLSLSKPQPFCQEWPYSQRMDLHTDVNVWEQPHRLYSNKVAQVNNTKQFKTTMTKMLSWEQKRHVVDRATNEGSHQEEQNKRAIERSLRYQKNRSTTSQWHLNTQT